MHPIARIQEDSNDEEASDVTSDFDHSNYKSLTSSNIRNNSYSSALLHIYTTT